MRMTDGDAAGDADAVDGEAHHLRGNVRALRQSLHVLGRRAVRGSPLFRFPEAIGDQLAHRLHRFVLVRPIGLDGRRSSLSRRRASSRP